MKTFKAYASWFIFNTIFTALAVAGYTFGYSGAANTIAFFIPLLFALSIVTSTKVYTEAAAKQFIKDGKPPKVNHSVDVIFDFAFTGFLAWHGAFYLATLYIMHTFFMAAAKARIREAVEEIEKQNLEGASSNGQ